MRRTLCESALSGVREDVDIDKALAEMSDGGAGAEAMYAEIDRRCFGVEDGTGSFYNRRIKAVRERIRYRDKSLLEVFDLIVKNGKDREESIWEMAKSASGTRKPGTPRGTATGRR